MRILSLIIVLQAFGLNFAIAQKFGYIDSDFILNKMPEYAKAQNEIDQLSSSWQKEIEEIRQQIGKINTENKSLSDQVNSLKTDPKAIERIAREEMGLARPGELIYKIPDSSKPGDPGKPDAGK